MTAPVEHSEHEASVEFGPRDIQFAPLPSIVPLEQVRKEYPAESLDELKGSMVRETDDGLECNLLNPLVVARLDAEYAARYLADLNSFWGTNFVLDELPQHEAGDYLFLIAGHRRHRSIHGIVQDYDLEVMRDLSAIAAHSLGLVLGEDPHFCSACRMRILTYTKSYSST